MEKRYEIKDSGQEIAMMVARVVLVRVSNYAIACEK